MADLRTFGVVLFKGFELLDVFGPLEAWGMLANMGQCKVTTVAERGGPVTSAQGPKAIAVFGFADCPHLDLILIPGGIGTREEISNQLLLDWLKARAEKAEVVTTVCTGTAILARTGLLDGRRATTNKRAFKWVAEQGPKVNWVREAGRGWAICGLVWGVGGNRHGPGRDGASIRCGDGGADRDRDGVRVASRC